MNLHEEIYRIKEIMENLDKNNPEFILEKIFFSKIFDNLRIVDKTVDGYIQFDWFNDEGKRVLTRNHWGRLWIDDCDIYENLISNPKKYLSLSGDEIVDYVCEYLNKKYVSEFEKQPLKDVSKELDCNEEEWW